MNDTHQRVLHRLKIARGHLDKVITMVENDEYCIDILTQSKAVRSALSNSDALLLEHHLSHCVVDHVKNGQSKEAIDEVMKIFEKNN
jgi:CsoR family transcriptional regulator, copper-sensing transcriptional repressor